MLVADSETGDDGAVGTLDPEPLRDAAIGVAETVVVEGLEDGERTLGDGDRDLTALAVDILEFVITGVFLGEVAPVCVGVLLALCGGNTDGVADGETAGKYAAGAIPINTSSGTANAIVDAFPPVTSTSQPRVWFATYKLKDPVLFTDPHMLKALGVSTPVLMTPRSTHIEPLNVLR